MIVKAQSLGSNQHFQETETRSIFQVPHTMRLNILTPKNHISVYLQACTEIQLKNSIVRNDEFSNSRVRINSPTYTEPSATSTIQSSKKIKQYKQYLNNYVKNQNSSYSPAQKVVKSIKAPEFWKITGGIKNATSSHTPQRKHYNVIRRVRPARFLSQEDIENLKKPPRESKPPKFQHNKEDLKILLETNHNDQLKNLEKEKIIRAYNLTYKKASSMKRKDWTWSSPEGSPRNVQFKDID